MKSLTVIAIVFFISCSNPKVKIVEQQKKLRDSIVKLKGEYAIKMLSRSIKMRDSVSVAHPDWERLGLLSEAVKMDTLGYKLTEEMRTLSDSIQLMRGQFDSLELELKKY